jgi:hypothetical protein
MDRFKNIVLGNLKGKVGNIVGRAERGNFSYMQCQRKLKSVIRRRQ